MLQVFPLFLYKLHIWMVSFAHELLQHVFSSLPFLYSQIENFLVTKISFEWSLQLMNTSFHSYFKKISNTCKFYIWMVYFPHGHVFSCDLFENKCGVVTNFTFQRFLLLMIWCHMCLYHVSFYDAICVLIDPFTE